MYNEGCDIAVYSWSYACDELIERITWIHWIQVFLLIKFCILYQWQHKIISVYYTKSNHRKNRIIYSITEPQKTIVQYTQKPQKNKIKLYAFCE
jgi:hypothetical protein